MRFGIDFRRDRRRVAVVRAKAVRNERRDVADTTIFDTAGADNLSGFADSPTFPCEISANDGRRCAVDRDHGSACCRAGRRASRRPFGTLSKVC
ncbi:MAG: hypothetical protein D6741_02660 [Planctomycetota bacterium]|nr:MAG: hypothetical protein D6741_02660 [Planctomycetota bacterium]